MNTISQESKLLILLHIHNAIMFSQIACMPKSDIGRHDTNTSSAGHSRCAPLPPAARRTPAVRCRRPMLALTQLSNYLTLKGSFSAVSKPNFASKYALESSRRDLQNALLCTVLVGSVLKAQIFVLR